MMKRGHTGICTLNAQNFKPVVCISIRVKYFTTAVIMMSSAHLGYHKLNHLQVGNSKRPRVVPHRQEVKKEVI
jgi:hypothetical protein